MHTSAEVKQKGFIRIPVLAMALLVIILSGVGYVGTKQYQSYQKEKLEAEKQAKISAEKISELEKQVKQIEPKASNRDIKIPPTQKETNVPSIQKTEELVIKNIAAIPSANETVIKWVTNIPAIGKVTIWPTNTETGNLVMNTTYGTSHEVVMTSIQAKKYFYIVEVTSVGGATAISEQKEFITPTDNIAPTIKSIKLSKDAGIPHTIYFIVTTNEPAKLIIKYKYQLVRFPATGEASKSSDDFHTISKVSIPVEPYGQSLTETYLYYSVYALDKDLNISEPTTGFVQSVSSIPLDATAPF